MDGIFENLRTQAISDRFMRNIKSLRESVDLFDDLTDDPDESVAAHALRDSVHPMAYTSPPAIHRPFDLADYTRAIDYPFKNWTESRYSDGTYGVWYGADTLETSISETVYHWARWLEGLSYSEDFAKPGDPVVGERKVYAVHCDALLLDLRPKVTTHPGLVDPESYRFTQPVGARLQYEGHPGLLTRSARCEGDVSAIFRPAVLMDPQAHCYLTYSGEIGRRPVVVERQPGEIIATM